MLFFSFSKIMFGGTVLQTFCASLSACGLGLEIYDAIFNPAVYTSPEFLAQHPPIEYVKPGYLDSPIPHVYADGWEKYYAAIWGINTFLLFMTPGNWYQGIILLVLIEQFPIPSIIPYNYPVPIV